MCKEIEKVLNETSTNDVIACSVTMEGKTHTSDDFVAILSRDNGDASIFYNTDALTLGMSMKMVAKAFVDAMAQLSEEERAEIQEVLGEAFVYDKPEEVQ